MSSWSPFAEPPPDAAGPDVAIVAVNCVACGVVSTVQVPLYAAFATPAIVTGVPTARRCGAIVVNVAVVPEAVAPAGLAASATGGAVSTSSPLQTCGCATRGFDSYAQMLSNVGDAVA